MLVIPEATLLELNDYRLLRQAMLTQCADKQDRVAILDVIGTDRSFPSADLQDGRTPSSTTGSPIFATAWLLRPKTLKFGMAYAPFLKTSLVDIGDFSFANFDSDSKATVTALLESEIDRLYPARGPQRPKPQNRSAATIWDAEPPTRTVLGQKLVAQIPAARRHFRERWRRNAARFRRAPPSPASTPKTIMRVGVWKAPANIGLIAVTAPTLPINDAMQDDLDVPLDGLAVNAIR